MIDVTKTLFSAFLSGVFGFVFTIFISILAIYYPSVFWILLVLIWFIVGLVNGLLRSSWKECLIVAGVVGGITLIIMFFAMLLLGIFSDALVDIFNISYLFSADRIIGFALTYAFISAIILFSIVAAISIASFYIKKWYIDSKGVQSTDELEIEYYSEFEQPDTGQITETEKLDDPN